MCLLFVCGKRRMGREGHRREEWRGSLHGLSSHRDETRTGASALAGGVEGILNKEAA